MWLERQLASAAILVVVILILLCLGCICVGVVISSLPQVLYGLKLSMLNEIRAYNGVVSKKIPIMLLC